MPSKHQTKSANNKKTGKKHVRRHHRRSQKKQMGGSPASRSVMDFVNTSGHALDDYAVGMELPSMDKITKCATQQMGGSLVSDTVMSAQTGMNDYQSQANLPAMSQLGGTNPSDNRSKREKAMKKNSDVQKSNKARATDATGPVPARRTGRASTYRTNNQNTQHHGGYGSCGSTTPQNLLGNGNLGKQQGGSPASDRLDSFTQVHNTSNLNEKKGDVISADMISGGAQPNLYQLTGGKRKGKRGSKKMMKQKGGSFWNLAGCGPWNGTDAGRKYADYFTKSSKCPGPEWYANPPELPKAGSGDAADLIVGATYPFA